MGPVSGAQPEPEVKSELADRKMEVEKRQKPAFNIEDLRALADYYQIRQLPASRFLNALRRNKVIKLQEEDVQRCLDGLGANDPEFARTLDLLYCAVGSQTPLTRQCQSFASQACRQQVVANYKIDLDLSRSPNALFAEVFQALKSDLIGKTADNRSLNLLKAVGIWQSYSKNLDDVEAARFLAKEFLPTKGNGNFGIPAVLDILFRPTTKRQTMIEMLRVAEGGLIKAQLAQESDCRERQQRDKETKRAQEYLEQLKAARTELEQNNIGIAELKFRLAMAERESATLEEKINHEKVVCAHLEGQLKGRSRVFLEKTLSPLLETVREFAQLEPPRVGIIVERLDIANDEIRREVEWLRSSD